MTDGKEKNHVPLSSSFPLPTPSSSRTRISLPLPSLPPYDFPESPPLCSASSAAPWLFRARRGCFLRGLSCFYTKIVTNLNEFSSYFSFFFKFKSLFPAPLPEHVHAPPGELETEAKRGYCIVSSLKQEKHFPLSFPPGERKKQKCGDEDRNRKKLGKVPCRV